MQADFGGGRLEIAHLPRRRAKPHLFSDQGRSLLIAGLAAAALIGAGVAFGHGQAPVRGQTPYAFIGG